MKRPQPRLAVYTQPDTFGAWWELEGLHSNVGINQGCEPSWVCQHFWSVVEEVKHVKMETLSMCFSSLTTSSEHLPHSPTHTFRRGDHSHRHSHTNACAVPLGEIWGLISGPFNTLIDGVETRAEGGV